jgi:hypothetical protein
MSKRTVLFVSLVSVQLAALIWTAARGQLHLSVLAWLAIIAACIVLAFITSILITDLVKEVFPIKKRS